MSSAGFAANVYRCLFCRTEGHPPEQLVQLGEGSICAGCHERVGVILRRQAEERAEPPAS